MVGSRAVALSDPSRVVGEDLLIVSGRYGTAPKVLRAMGSLDRLEGEGPATLAGKAAKKLGADEVLDIGYQDGPTNLDSTRAFFGKWKNPDWVRNIIAAGTKRGQITGEQIDILQRFFEQHTFGFEERTLNALRASLQKILDGLALQRQKIQLSL